MILDAAACSLIVGVECDGSWQGASVAPDRDADARSRIDAAPRVAAGAVVARVGLVATLQTTTLLAY